MTQERLKRASDAVEQLRQACLKLSNIGIEECEEMTPNDLMHSGHQKLSSLIFCAGLKDATEKLVDANEQIQDLIKGMEEGESNESKRIRKAIET